MTQFSAGAPEVKEAAIWLARLRADDRSTEDERAFRAWLMADPRHAAAFEVGQQRVGQRRGTDARHAQRQSAIGIRLQPPRAFERRPGLGSCRRRHLRLRAIRRRRSLQDRSRRAEACHAEGRYRRIPGYRYQAGGGFQRQEPESRSALWPREFPGRARRPAQLRGRSGAETRDRHALHTSMCAAMATISRCFSFMARQRSRTRRRMRIPAGN